MNPNQTDPVIDEIREVRHRISARFDHDPDRLVAYYIELQQQYADRLMDTSTVADMHPGSRPTTPGGARGGSDPGRSS